MLLEQRKECSEKPAVRARERPVQRPWGWMSLAKGTAAGGVLAGAW